MLVCRDQSSQNRMRNNFSIVAQINLGFCVAVTFMLLSTQFLKVHHIRNVNEGYLLLCLGRCKCSTKSILRLTLKKHHKVLGVFITAIPSPLQCD